MSKQTLFSPRHIHAEHFHCQCVGWFWFQLWLVSKDTDISWTFLRPHEWQFSIFVEWHHSAREGIMHAIQSCFCIYISVLLSSTTKYSAFILWFVEGSVTLWGVLGFPKRKTTKWAAQGELYIQKYIDVRSGCLSEWSSLMCLVHNSAWFAL